ncbi:hypothetical protein ABZ214_01425 [Streptomyces iakyrus]|uniref:hypothetical protein n=1 Tax=Streptomyces iakyrus TaxID=68219 RepID=UPI0033B2C2DB
MRHGLAQAATAAMTRRTVRAAMNAGATAASARCSNQPAASAATTCAAVIAVEA